MVNDPAGNGIDEFFRNLKVQHRYYSIQQKQPILLIGEKDLYEAIKKALESNLKLNQEIKQFKPLPGFSLPKL